MDINKEFRNYAVKHIGISSLSLHRYDNALINHGVTNMTRSIIEERQVNFREIDVFSRLMQDRIIFLGMPIDDIVCNIVTAQLLFLDNLDPSKEITMYINSPGGSVYDGYGIRDVMQYVTPEVSTVAISLAASMAAILLTSGAAGKRYSLPYSRIMLHQPLGAMQGQASDMEISYKQISIIKKELYEIIQMHLPDNKKKSLEQIEKDCDRDYWMNGKEAVEYGIIDEVIERR